MLSSISQEQCSVLTRAFRWYYFKIFNPAYIWRPSLNATDRRLVLRDLSSYPSTDPEGECKTYDNLYNTVGLIDRQTGVPSRNESSPELSRTCAGQPKRRRNASGDAFNALDSRLCAPTTPNFCTNKRVATTSSRSLAFGHSNACLRSGLSGSPPTPPLLTTRHGKARLKLSTATSQRIAQPSASRQGHHCHRCRQSRHPHLFPLDRPRRLPRRRRGLLRSDHVSLPHQLGSSQARSVPHMPRLRLDVRVASPHPRYINPVQGQVIRALNRVAGSGDVAGHLGGSNPDVI